MHKLVCDLSTGSVNQIALTPEEELERSVAEAAWLASENERAAKSARDSRDTLLAECDWVVVMSLEAGRAIPTDLATYRQALRDIPQQAGFPTAIVWPMKP